MHTGSSLTPSDRGNDPPAWSDAAEGADPLPGVMLANTYIVEAMLGEGGMGRVYSARHTRVPAKRFAIKVLHEEFAQHEEALARFKREAEAAAMINNPHVVGVHDVGQTPDGRPFLVCDFLEGEELADWLQQEGQLAVPDAARIFRQVCAGLMAAHDEGVVHRDVKPENVFLVPARGGPIVKVIDFGISRLAGGGGTKLTQAGVALGTPDFMSPEQARGATVDHRTDIYAVGVMLYAALTGVTPFERSSPHATLVALLTQEPPPPRMFEESIPLELELVIQKAMAKEAADRYQSMVELRDALAPFDTTAGEHGVQKVDHAPAATASTSARIDLDDPRAAPAQVVAFGSLSVFAIFAAGLLAMGGAARTAGVDLGMGGWIVVGLGMVSALAAPTFLAVRHVRRHVWGNTLRAVALARSLRTPLIIGAAAYGLTSLVARLVESVVLGPASGASWPLWDVLTAFAGIAAASVAATLARRSWR